MERVIAARRHIFRFLFYRFVHYNVRKNAGTFGLVIGDELILVGLVLSAKWVGFVFGSTSLLHLKVYILHQHDYGSSGRGRWNI